MVSLYCSMMKRPGRPGRPHSSTHDHDHCLMVFDVAVRGQKKADDEVGFFFGSDLNYTVVRDRL